MSSTLSRRRVIGAGLLPGLIPGSNLVRSQASAPSFVLPIRWPGQPSGQGFFIRHGYACENTWYLPGYWHAGEDWYALDGRNTAPAKIVACSEGQVVFAGSDYPGRVVIIQHEAGLFSMYGHLDYALRVAEGERVTVGQTLGTVLDRTDGRAESHLHFEMRTFLTTPEVNGDQPRFGFACGYQCAPGPGYWPIDAPEHPSAMGWRNPSHVIASRSASARGLSVTLSGEDSATIALWSAPDEDGERTPTGEIDIAAVDRVRVDELVVGDEASETTGANAYDIWAAIQTDDGADGWIEVVSSSDQETGGDGEPSTVVWNVLLETTTGDS